jgi:hypothetical protein
MYENAKGKAGVAVSSVSRSMTVGLSEMTHAVVVEL